MAMQEWLTAGVELASPHLPLPETQVARVLARWVALCMRGQLPRGTSPAQQDRFKAGVIAAGGDLDMVIESSAKVEAAPEAQPNKYTALMEARRRQQDAA